MPDAKSVYDLAMRPLTRSLCCGLSLVAGLALAQTPVESPLNAGFDCWIGNDGRPFYTAYIRCLADRDIVPALPTHTPLSIVLDRLHHDLHHDGSSKKVEATFNANIELLKGAAGVWNIVIQSYPSDWSWEEEMPARLVRGVLCPDVEHCPILIRK